MAIPKKKPNIIFITFDAGRPDHLGYMGYKKNTSPFLDSLAGKGTYFTRAFSTGPGSPHSFVAIFTSTFPFDYGGFEYIERPRVLVSEILKKHGYVTMGFHSGAYMSGYFGYDRGWDRFEYLSHFKGGDMMKGIKRDTWQTGIIKKMWAARRWVRQNAPWANGIFTAGEKFVFGIRKIAGDITHYQFPFYTADEMNEVVKKALPRKPAKPLFLWVHYLDTHGSYGLFLRKSRNLLKKLKFMLGDWLLYFFGEFYFLNRWFISIYLDLYDSSIKYVDEHIEKLFAHLGSIGVLDDDSVVIVCSDHGEEFLERKWVGHSDSLWNINLNVPLIFHSKRNIQPGKVIARPVSLIDLGPTILNIAGLPKEPTFKGKNIFDASERPIIGQVPDTDTDLSNQTFLGAAVIYDGYKLIHMIGKKMLFSLDDFGEKTNLYDKERGIADRLAKILKPYESIRSNK
ncbi:MAG: sulfatase [Candidatus Liptonbacteria bacterium]|nr:sulfatase [Candidatus Liptonbacteria bacterium]